MIFAYKTYEVNGWNTYEKFGIVDSESVEEARMAISKKYGKSININSLKKINFEKDKVIEVGDSDQSSFPV